jgi:DNA-binding CsgD family transcriptional regulator
MPGQLAGGPPDHLRGRDTELRRVAGFLSDASGQGSALLVAGEAGIGKTALLSVAADLARREGRLVLAAGGVEFESAVAFAALNQLLTPLLGDLAGVPLRHGTTLSVALGLTEGRAVERAEVTAAVVWVLRREVTLRPLLVVVDDLHWVDPSSRGVLADLSRELGGTGIGLLMSCRSGEEGLLDGWDAWAVPRLDLAPLQPEAAADLLGTRFPGLASRVAQRVLAEAGGNPLALIELPAALDDSQRSAAQALPAVLPVTARLQALFTERLGALPESTRELLLLAALDGTGDGRLLRTAAGTAAGPPELVPTEAGARLVTWDHRADRLSFRHPLVRAAIVAGSSSEERRAAHRRLAALLADQPERRAWHLAEATVDVDEEVAALLDRVARREQRLGDVSGAVDALLRAAQLSPATGDRARRLAEAAYLSADATGDLALAAQVLLDARQSDAGSGGALRTATAAAYVLFSGEGDHLAAHRLLVASLAADLPAYRPGDAARAEAVGTLLVLSVWGQRPELWAAFYEHYGRLEPGEDPLLDLEVATLADPARTAAGAIAALDAALARLDEETDPTRVCRVARAATYLDRGDRCRQSLERLVSDGRRGGAVGAQVQALRQLELDAFARGRWEDAERLAVEGLSLSVDRGYGTAANWFRAAQAQIAAARGDGAELRQLAEQVARWAVPRGAGGPLQVLRHARGLAALGNCEFEEAYREFSSISPAGTFAAHVPHALRVPLFLVEAAVRTGRTAEAARHVDAMTEAGMASWSPRLALAVAGAAAIAAPHQEAVERFDHALALPQADQWPFEVARVHLAYGEHLRRARAITRSRAELAAAAEGFDRLGARAWADRARTELAVTGGTRGRRQGIGWGRLTPQEHEIAALAASGLTNRQIAQRLSVSPRTVGAHLRSLFPKLGVTSRAALRDALTLAAPQAEAKGAGRHPPGNTSADSWAVWSGPPTRSRPARRVREEA